MTVALAVLLIVLLVTPLPEMAVELWERRKRSWTETTRLPSFDQGSAGRIDGRSDLT